MYTFFLFRLLVHRHTIQADFVKLIEIIKVFTRTFMFFYMVPVKKCLYSSQKTNSVFDGGLMSYDHGHVTQAK